MNITIGWRLLATLRRIALAHERSATALEELARIQTSRWEAETVRPVARKKMVFGTLSIEEANKEWDRRLRQEIEE